ncbi:MAG: alpha-glucosidase/alpha-galactosidase [Phycisphaeraceae bacterium]|nr:alpha-glucosidase/alpha-galactosidase [Phycisphaeraceae bacterium]
MAAEKTAVVDEALKSHTSHTKTADDPAGLPGKFLRPIKVTMLGAGSGFTPRLVNDVLRIPTADQGQIALVDVDEDRLHTMRDLIQKLIAQLGKPGWTVIASRDRTQVMGNSDYVVCCVEVSGTACVAFDNDIPLKYGIDQCIGDTIGPGGLFKALRTVPVWLEILRDCERLCPSAIVLNYTNPMNIMCLAAGRSSRMPIVGLCHSVQGTSHLLAEYAGVPYDEMTWECAGINHLAWFTTLEHQGKDLYTTVLVDKFRREIAEGIEEADKGLTRTDAGDYRDWNNPPPKTWKHEDLIRKDMCVNFGAFITESSGHLSEYLPYYRKSASGRKLLRMGYHGGTRFYASNWPQWRKNADAERMAMVKGETPMDWARSWEYASWIIEAREKDRPYRIHGNVMNFGCCGRGEAGKLITNLPGDGCVEVSCMIDRTGINPTRYGKLPAQMANICVSNMSMFDLAATACMEKSKEAAIHALMFDPLTAAICTPGEIRDMTLEMFDAEKDFLPGYK